MTTSGLALATPLSTATRSSSVTSGRASATIATSCPARSRSDVATWPLKPVTAMRI